ncbi:conserved hypothetical protein [Bradyrhizobium sp. ORS 278]|uniref:Probable inorganic carbon transporter subunit DabA 1 n=1 Tax=Bradyrhizobium sp. (strain ORS 278) TaxID=114615 RepID=DABA1_BRASO|nr:DUF2309 domain-containing protein [Bradyrhizobium sp. ORS 278]A4YQE4.1 RecName: Full=Probable inorganic carbon transporter subunit DabA 1 [Bradyrhizobium sp. ORS 278]CAL76120.1 conserved hypothetical protein [Bradyrhizobium sp. ORS 278]
MIECDAPAVALAPTPALHAAIAGACRRIAPLWPLKNFVAVNPFMGFSGQSFHATCATLHRVARLETLMPRAFYREAIRSGTIERADLAAALAAAPADWCLPTEVGELLKLADNDKTVRKHPAVVATVAEVLTELAAGDRHVARTAFMTDEISRWCAAYFDEGQSVWRMPARGLRPYAAWRASVRYDRNPEAMGIARFRELVAELPEDYVAAIATVVDRLGVPARAIEDYLHQALLEIGGWAAYARYLMWDHELAGDRDDTLEQLLAIRVVWGYALFVQRTDAEFREAWRRAMEQAALPPLDDKLGGDPDLCINMVLQEAYEIAFRRRLLHRLGQSPAAQASGARPAVQAAFCIDVRSEVYRRAMESISSAVETIGFAGFFGFPIEFVPIGHITGRAHCPVLLRPQFTVCEAVDGTSEDEDSEILVMRLLRRRVRKAWKSFKLSAVSSFIYVETAGLLFAGKILSDSLAVTRTVHDPNTDGLDDAVIGRLGPRISPRLVGGRATGFDQAQRVAMAEAVLRAMSMTGPFARLVMLTGHGSTSVNNPHAAGLDCGACGGNTGEANARVAAAILNDSDVRAGLRDRGIDIPEDTFFLGCLHDTTTDEIKLYDLERLPASHREDLRVLRELLAKATSLTRLERATLLGVAGRADAEQRVVTRSRDWAQVRPEWGLAGNASFIAAPRARTRGIDLGGRAFLHEYDWRQDKDFATLQLIMTAPMVVASWINLQYYGSTVNNAAFGAGNKVLHNVAGTIGVLEGNAGDLKVGLPWQSVHDGTRFVHEPLRLAVLIEAPLEAIGRVIAQNSGVRELVDNAWLHLYAISGQGRVSHRYRSGLQWQAIDPQS